MKILYSFILTGLFQLIYAQNLNVEWSKQFGSTGAKANAQTITTDPFGNLFTLGTFSGSVDFDPGPGVFTLTSGTYGSSFICKLDSLGSFLWAGKMDLNCSSIMLDKYGNVFVLGTYGNSLDVDPGPGVFGPTYQTDYPGKFTCIVKLNNSCDFIWAKFFYSSGIDGCVGSSICLDSKQNIYVGGSFIGFVDFDPGAAILNVNSNTRWVPSRSAYPISTYFMCSLDSLGNYRYVKKAGNGINFQNGGFEFGDITSTTNDETIACITGSNDSYEKGKMSSSPQKIKIEKRDVDGDVLWAKVIGSPSSTSTASVFSPKITTDIDGNIWVAGYFKGLIDFDPNPSTSYNRSTRTDGDLCLFILKLDMNGDFQQVLQIGPIDGKSVLLNDIFTDKDGNCYLGGWLKGTVDFGPGPTTAKLTSTLGNGFLSKLNQDCSLNWSMLIGENASSNLFSTCIGNDGHFYLTGSFSGTGDFNPGTGNYNLVSTGPQDAYILKFRGPLIYSMLEDGFKDCVHFFPNPVTSNLYVNTPNEMLHGRCVVIDVNGKIIQEYSDISGKAFSIDLSALQRGFYILAISDGKSNVTAKILKD